MKRKLQVSIAIVLFVLLGLISFSGAEQVPSPSYYAHLDNGLSFESSYDEVKAAFGEPIEADDLGLDFATANGYLVRFQFVPDLSAPGNRKLINVEICHPDSGE